MTDDFDPDDPFPDDLIPRPTREEIERLPTQEEMDSTAEAIIAEYERQQAAWRAERSAAPTPSPAVPARQRVESPPPPIRTRDLGGDVLMALRRKKMGSKEPVLSVQEKRAMFRKARERRYAEIQAALPLRVRIEMAVTRMFWRLGQWWRRMCRKTK